MQDPGPVFVYILNTYQKIQVFKQRNLKKNQKLKSWPWSFKDSLSLLKVEFTKLNLNIIEDKSCSNIETIAGISSGFIHPIGT